MSESLMEDQSEEHRKQSLLESDGGRPDVKRDVSDLDPSLLAYLAEDIEVAHRVNPNSWSLYRVATGEVILIVQSMAVTGVSKDRGGILVLGDLDSPTFQSVDRSRVKKGFKDFPGFRIDADSTDRFDALIREFKTPHHEGITRLASTVKTRSHFATDHQRALLDALSAAVGRTLPQPAYKQAGPGPAPPPPDVPMVINASVMDTKVAIRN